MRSRRYSIWQKVAALAPIALMLVYLPGQMYLRCRIDGSIRSICCCRDEAQQENPDAVARAQDCCDREVSTNARPVVDAASSELELAPAVATFTPVALAALTPAAPHVDRAWAAHGPPRGGPAVVLLKHSFLI